jgi:hypothetical protein
MATLQTIQYTDDLDGKPLEPDDHEHIRFAYAGKIREMDLSRKHADLYRRAMEKFVDVARVVGKLPESGPYLVSNKPAARAQGTDAARSREEFELIREWARVNGWPNLSDRGRIPGSVLTAYANRTLKANRPAKTKPTTKPAAAKPTTGKPAATATSAPELPPKPAAKRNGATVPTPAFRAEGESATAC